MKASEMSNKGIASHLQNMTNTGLYKEVPPAAKAVFEEAIERLKEYDELNKRASKFFNDVLPQAGKLCIQDF